MIIFVKDGEICLPSMFLVMKSTRKSPGHDAGTKICPSGVTINGQDSVTMHISKSDNVSGH